jgi:hypothetical protein
VHTSSKRRRSRPLPPLHSLFRIGINRAGPFANKTLQYNGLMLSKERRPGLDDDDLLLTSFLMVCNISHRCSLLYGNNTADVVVRRGNSILQAGICVVTGATTQPLLAQFASTQLQLHKLQAMMRVLL